MNSMRYQFNTIIPMLYRGCRKIFEGYTNMIEDTMFNSLFVNMFGRASEQGENNFSNVNGTRNVRGVSVDAGVASASENGVFLRNKTGSTNLWRPSSLVNLINPRRKRGSTTHDSRPTTPTGSTPESPTNPMSLFEMSNVPENELSNISDNNNNSLVLSNRHKPSKSPKKSGGWGTLLSLVVVEAKGLPNSPTDGTSQGIYCKIRLGTNTFKSKTVPNSVQPVWRERFQMHILKDNLLRVSLWDKGKQKTFMGSSVLDLSLLEKERTHEIWQELEDGYGRLHLSITICNIRRRKQVDIEKTDEVQLEKISLLNRTTEWKLVGQLFVKVVSAKGLSGRPNAYCTLEVDNERVQTHSARGSAEPIWNKNFVFNVYDVTSTLDLKVYDNSLMNAIHSESIGRLSIPLLRIRNGEMKWYALKDKYNRNVAKGNSPRVLLEMSLFWNPVKASLRLFQPREVKYMKKPQKFDISLVYKNVEFVRDAFVLILNANDGYKHFMEWENQELNIAVLTCWLLFWYHFRMWATPLLLLAPFIYFWISNKHYQRSFMRGYGIVETPDSDTSNVFQNVRNMRTLGNRMQEFPEMTLTITASLDYIASLTERFYNLASFKVPFLSYITMLILVAASGAFYLIPFNYIMMIFGIYKFSRNYFRSEKILNNDLEDFLSRIPDTDILEDWKELTVPEPSPVNGINIGSNPYTSKGSVMY